jgi:hypothetical protein
MRRILFQETDFGALPNPPAGFKYIGFDGPNFTEKDNTGATTPAGGGGGYIDITYSEIIYAIDEGVLIPGSYYRITDFRTCYDVPEYYLNGNSKTFGAIDYVQGSLEPIIVLATSTNKISSTAYQPSYPNDRIQYDCTFNSTSNTGGTAYGRITERIDEFNNRTDYDHRNITFNRFQSYNQDSQLTGTINSYDSSTGIITGNGTLFLDEVETGDILFFEYQGYMAGVKVVSATASNTTILVVVDSLFGSTINFTGGTIPFYTSTSTGNYYEYKEVYVGQKNEEDFERILTFNLDGSAIHNYVGDYSKFYLNELGSNSGFLLANNVFYGNRTYSNTIGDRSYNNTGTYWFSRNTIAGRFYNNVIYNNGFYSNSIGEYFDNNIVKGYTYDNTIEQYFENNKIYRNFNNNKIGNGLSNNVIYRDFNNNKIDNGLNSNVIYSDFYDNQIGLYFNGNTIGDNGNLGNFNFYRNRIGNNFEYNTVRQNFQNNQIGNQFNNNTANGDFYKNVIGNGFNYNQNIGYDFYGNHIGNGFNNNELIGDYFYNNQIGEYFNNNSISYLFNNNQIGNTFEENTLGDIQYFKWNDTSIENLTTRNYNTFYNSLYGDGGENIGNVILGKELIMHFTHSGTVINSGELIIGEAYEITNYLGNDDFTDIADVQSGNINENGCVFVATGHTVSNWSSQSELTELTSYDEYHKVKFTQWTQNSNGGGFSYERTKVYPTSEPTVYFTKLNYQSKVDVIIEGRLEIKRNNNGGIYNVAVEGNFNNNVSPQETQWNSIYTQGEFYFENNEIQNEFAQNQIYRDFKNNEIQNGFVQNQIYIDFYNNSIENDSSNNYFYNGTYDNNIGNLFQNNTIGTYETKGEFEFNNNTIGYFCKGNYFKQNFSTNYFGDYLWNNEFLGDTDFNKIEVSFQANDSHDYFSNNIIGNYCHDNIFGTGSSNNVIGSEFSNNTISENLQDNRIGNGYQYNTIGNNFYNNVIGNDFSENNISYNFAYNVIGNNFYYNNIENDFGFGGNIARGNRIGNNFNYNKIGEYFYDNKIADLFQSNTASNYFQMNDIKSQNLNSVDFTTNNGNILSFSYSFGGELPGDYDGVTVIGNTFSNVSGTYSYGGSTSSVVVDATFDIYVVDAGTLEVTLNNPGKYYLPTIGLTSSTITIVESKFANGYQYLEDSLIITINQVSDLPSVYAEYNTEIFKRADGVNRLSYYDDSDVLTIKDIDK